MRQKTLLRSVLCIAGSVMLVIGLSRCSPLTPSIPKRSQTADAGTTSPPNTETVTTTIGQLDLDTKVIDLDTYAELFYAEEELAEPTISLSRIELSEFRQSKKIALSGDLSSFKYGLAMFVLKAREYDLQDFDLNKFRTLIKLNTDVWTLSVSSDVSEEVWSQIQVRLLDGSLYLQKQRPGHQPVAQPLTTVFDLSKLIGPNK